MSDQPPIGPGGPPPTGPMDTGPNPTGQMPALEPEVDPNRKRLIVAIAVIGAIVLIGLGLLVGLAVSGDDGDDEATTTTESTVAETTTTEESTTTTESTTTSTTTTTAPPVPDDLSLPDDYPSFPIPEPAKYLQEVEPYDFCDGYCETGARYVAVVFEEGVDVGDLLARLGDIQTYNEWTQAEELPADPANHELGGFRWFATCEPECGYSLTITFYDPSGTEQDEAESRIGVRGPWMRVHYSVAGV